MKLGIFYIFLCFLFVACNQKFEKEEWKNDDFIYARRERMVKDLMDNHLKKGMKYKEVIDLLGRGENGKNDSLTTIYYDVMVDFGWNIDPQRTKTLCIEFTSDSTVKEFRLEKWEKH